LTVAYGVAVNKLSLPIPSSCPQVFSDLIKACWHTDPHMRLTFEEINSCLTEISNSPFAETPLDNFWTMQQDWRTEIEEMFLQMKVRENELRTREQEIERVQMRQQAYESMLRQREKALEEREKDLVIRELTVSLQQQKAILQNSALYSQQATPEPKKRKNRTRLLSNFLRSSSSHNHNNNNNTNNNLINNSTVNVNNKSFEISSPTDFQHCLSIKPEIMENPTSNFNLFTHSDSLRRVSNSSTPTDEQPNFYNSHVVTTATTPTIQTNNISLYGSGSGGESGSPSLRLKVMLQPQNITNSNSIYYLSPNRSRLQTKSISVDISDHHNLMPNNSANQNPLLLSNSNNNHTNHNSRSRSNNNNYDHQHNLVDERLSVHSISHSPSTRSISADVNFSRIKTSPHHESLIESTITTVTNQTLSTSIPVHGSNGNLYDHNIIVGSNINGNVRTNGPKKLGRILYEIGAFLSFVGLGRDFKHPNHEADGLSNSSITSNSSTSNTEKQLKTTKRSQVKKLTPNSSENNENLNQTDMKIASSHSNKSSHSLTRLVRNYPQRFKSLSSKHSNDIADDSNITTTINHVNSSKNNRTTTNHRLLSPAHASARCAASALAAQLAAAQASSTTNLSNNYNNNNLLSPTTINLQQQQQIPSVNQSLLFLQLAQNHRDVISFNNYDNNNNNQTLKSMQKKYSKSIDCTHYLEGSSAANATAVSPNSSNLTLSALNSDSNCGISFTGSLINKNNTKLIQQQSTSSSLCSSISPNCSSTSTMNNILQASSSSNYSPLIPRRSNYYNNSDMNESHHQQQKPPMVRINTIHRQQRIYEQSSPTQHKVISNEFFKNLDNNFDSNSISAQPNRPLTLDLKQSSTNGLKTKVTPSPLTINNNGLTSTMRISPCDSSPVSMLSSSIPSSSPIAISPRFTTLNKQ
jgi:hypothetical protein